MAALIAGEKARMFCLGNVARGGATRGGYVSPKIFVAINGIQVATARPAGAAQVDADSLTITDTRGNTPNTCQFNIRGFTPPTGATLVITRGSINSLTREFGGVIPSQDVGYLDTGANVVGVVRGIDPSWLAQQTLVSGRWANVSASVIAAALVPLGYTGHNIQAGLPVLDTFSYTNQPVGSVLAALVARFGGTAFFDYLSDLHCFQTTDPASPTNPTALTPTHPTLTAFLATFDLSQVVTRVWSEGGGVTCLADIGPGETILPVADVSWYPVGGGYVQCPNQRLTYGAAVPSAGGSLVGPGVTPSGAPAAVLVVGTGLGAGLYEYAYTWVTGAGETLPSAIFLLTTGLLAAPATAPTPTIVAGAGIDAGVHAYAVSFVTSGGETLPSPVSATVTAGRVPLPLPLHGPFTPTGATGGALTTNSWYGYNVTYVDDLGQETSAGFTQFTGLLNEADFLSAGNSRFALTNIPVSPNANVTARKIYRTAAQASVAAAQTAAVNLVLTIADNTTTTASDTIADGSRGAAIPGSNLATYPNSQVALTAIPVGSTGVTSRKLYRTVAGGSALLLLTTIADNTTTTYTDSTADASLGAAALTVGTATAQQAALSGIAIGPATVTSRKVYRTAVGGSQLKLLTTLANNTATTFADSTADGSLGANAPGSDTSGLTGAVGQVNPGSTTLILASAGAFAPTGGWVLTGGGGAPVRYTGITGNTLTGIAASGPGSILAPIAYNSTAVALACLTGIPASGAGAILYAILVGDPVNIVARYDGVPAQAALSALLDPTNVYGGARGVQEATLQDGTIGYVEARARAIAELLLRAHIDVAIQYTCQDVNSRAGRTIAVALPLQGVPSSSFKISQVTQTGYQPALNPTYTVTAGARFSYEQLLQQVGG